MKRIIGAAFALTCARTFEAAEDVMELKEEIVMGEQKVLRI